MGEIKMTLQELQESSATRLIQARQEALFVIAIKTGEIEYIYEKTDLSNPLDVEIFRLFGGRA
jgi:hypothetical protein